MTDVQQRAAARQFAADWEDRGDEKQETQAFWLALLQKVFGVDEPEKYISFERRVEVDDTRTGKRTTKFIDGYIPQTRVLVEQKGKDIVLTRGYKQSDGSLLSPYQQARRYGAYLPQSEQPRWIVVCNFQTFEVHDMNFPNGEPEVLTLADLAADCSKLNFLVNTGSDAIKHEEKVSLQAGELVGVLYDALLQQYKDPTDPKTLKSLNALCVRLVFCLYAEDAGIFNHRRDMFHDYLKDIPAHGIRKALVELFRTLDQKPQDRDKYLFDDNPTLAAFPYVNGGLFADEDIEIPPFTEEPLRRDALHQHREHPQGHRPPVFKRPESRAGGDQTHSGGTDPRGKAGRLSKQAGKPDLLRPRLRLRQLPHGELHLFAAAGKPGH